MGASVNLGSKFGKKGTLKAGCLSGRPNEGKKNAGDVLR